MALGVFFEIVILFILIFALVKGYRNGLFLLVTRPFGLFISLGVAILIYRELLDSSTLVGSGVVSFIIVLIFSHLICSIMLRLFAGLFDLGIIGIVNRLLGVLLSFFVACLIAWIFVSVADYLMRFSSSSADESFRAGRLFSFFLETSPLDLLLKF